MYNKVLSRNLLYKYPSVTFFFDCYFSNSYLPVVPIKVTACWYWNGRIIAIIIIVIIWKVIIKSVSSL